MYETLICFILVFNRLDYKTSNRLTRILLLFLFSFIFSFTYSQENTSTLCSDGIDNDNDGFIDCDDSDCIEIPNEGCTICGSGLGFADVLIEYSSGCPYSDSYPEGATGVSDYWGNNGDEPEFVFLGEGGFIKLGFTNNLLSNSGDFNIDLYIFEVGPLVEDMSIFLRPENTITRTILENSGVNDPDNDGFYFITDIGGATSSVDLDAEFPGYTSGTLRFDAIMLEDTPDLGCMGGTSGADIDAVCAVYSIDCAGTPFGDAVFDECGECLPMSDPTFNMSCSDCMGVVNGTAILDDCGECYEPNDSAFNSSCTDCLGVVNGTAIFDDCGECLEPDDPEFSTSCIDCLGQLNGTAVFDDCGECLDPNDSLFNLSCMDCLGVVNGTAIFDDCGDCYEPNDPAFNSSCTDCLGVLNGNAIIDECGDCLDPDDTFFNSTCLDCNGIINGNAILDDCGDCHDPNSDLYNAACLDCSGVPNGLAEIDVCGDCLLPSDPTFGLNCIECQIFVPNVFTPDEDGNNDHFRIYSCEEVSLRVNDLYIYDRWGELVFYFNDFSINSDHHFWDGTYLGEKAITAVYTYYFDIIHINGIKKLYTGTVTLLR